MLYVVDNTKHTLNKNIVKYTKNSMLKNNVKI